MPVPWMVWVSLVDLQGMKCHPKNAKTHASCQKGGEFSLLKRSVHVTRLYCDLV